jgi:hypothetical protein
MPWRWCWSKSIGLFVKEIAVKTQLSGVALVALATFGVIAETRAQGGKAPATGSGGSAKAKAEAKPEELYGDQGGEKVLPADTRVPNAVMRARLEDTFFKLSNPRIDEKRNTLLVDYEVVSKGKFEGGVLVFRGPDGSKAEIALNSLAGRDSGTIQLVGAKQFGSFKFRTKVQFPEDVELYVMRGDDRYDPPLKCMVSNSLVMGKMKTIAQPRNWTAKEIAQYTRPPLAFKNPNAHPEVGEDVPALPAAGGQFRFVDPEGRLLGLDYYMGNWDNRQVVGGLTPVFSADQPKQHTARSIAKKGYAVAGAELNLDKYVCGIRLLFQRVKADGSFDPKDAYAGAWIGVPPAKGEPTKLVNDGRRVLGIHLQRGAIVDRFALVAEGEKK